MIKNSLSRQRNICKVIQGFTIVEVVVVLLIIGLVFITASPLTGKATAYFNLQHTAAKMAADIRELQQRALSESSYRYFIKIYPDHYIMRKSTHPVSTKVATVHLPTTVRIEHTNFPEHEIGFRKGHPRPTGGTITIRDQVTGKYRYVIIASVTGESGMINVQPIERKILLE